MDQRLEFEVAFHIRLICDDSRKSSCWALSEYPFEEDVVDRLIRAYCDTRDMQIRDSALFVFDNIGIRKGAISENAAFVPFSTIVTPLSTFLINDRLLELIEGETFLEKLLNLNSALDRNSDDFKSLLATLDTNHGVHCISTLHRK